MQNATPRGGSAPLVEAEQTETPWILTASEDGSGIPDRGRIFDHFERPEHSPAGVGLGLPIARQSAGVMSGELWLEERSRPGACFRFSLPRTRRSLPGPKRLRPPLG